jgi:hypothetical protein
MTENRAEHHLKTGRSQVTLGTRLIACSLLIVLVQILLRLTQGEWITCDIARLWQLTGAGTPATTLPRLAPIVDLILAIPLSAGIAAIGFVIAWIGASTAETATRAINSEN